MNAMASVVRLEFSEHLCGMASEMDSKLQQRFTLGRQSSGAPGNDAVLASDASGGLDILMATPPHTWRCARD
ncbi:hypothetical protein PHJA_002211400 [Phtheirospermum japonicum]|uniref:Uncharacterized protein n=1 Tax=Phtheirospermum japonicum TaxID=374723 RepID=A0A830CX08_9LAMI|nr:hypothetical protein PHJA_002211400 [Phtheirospermum japonicum]